MLKFLVFFGCLFYLMGAFTASGHVVLILSNATKPFFDMEANFAPPVNGSGIHGRLSVAEPLDACSPLTNKIVSSMNDTRYPFVLIMRGGCSFEEKVRRAQAAGFQAAIIYNTGITLIAMAGNSDGIKINAVSVSRLCGETLKKYAGAADVEIWIVANFGNSVWSIMGMAFISTLAMSAVLVTCFFVRSQHQIRREQPLSSHVRRLRGMSSRLVKAMPSLIFTADLEDNCTSTACAICLEDYNVGEKIRILPCRHKFHAICVDAWLTSWRTFCPVCKRDARNCTHEPPTSESTPLLSSSPNPVSTAPVLSSIRSSIATLAALQTGPSSYPSRSVSCPQSISSTLYNHHSLLSHDQSPHISTSQSSVDLRHMSSQKPDGAYLVSPHSFGCPTLSALNSRYMSPYIQSPGNASLSYVGSSNRQRNPLHYDESAGSLSLFASAPSLPGC